jgi:Sulfatase
MVNPVRLTQYQQMKEIIGSPRLFIILSFFYPASYLLEINSHVYATDQIIVTLIFVLLISVITALAGGISVNYFVKVILIILRKIDYKTNITFISSKLYRAVLGGVGMIILLVLMHSTTRELIPVLHNVLWTVPYIILSLGVSILTYSFKLELLNYILIGLIVTNCALGILHSFQSESLNIDTDKIQKGLIFKQKPNVYMVVLESYASLDIREKIYGINNVPLIRELNEKYYEVYESYANYWDTLSSIASVFLMDHHYYKPSKGIGDGSGYRKIIGGVVDNSVINVFLSNGYRIDYSKFNSSLYYPSSTVNAEEIHHLLRPMEVFSGLSLILDKILRCYPWITEFSEFFQSLCWLPEKIIGNCQNQQKTAKNSNTGNDGRPLFSLIYAGASHTPNFLYEYPYEISSLPGAHRMSLWKLNRVNSYWISTYKNSIDKSDAILIGLIRDLSEKDPDAIVILLGDHGAAFNRDCWIGENSDINENILQNGMQPAEVTRDLLAVFMAIKWPTGAKKPHEYFSHVNIFRQVFAVLVKDESILKTQVSNDSFTFASKTKSYLRKIDIYRTVKDGKLLDRWE